ncbi:sialate O-acetylesterase [Catalinimonas alkaloidigena]|uniref:sialate O-acetylesterase n=1 Tax=Catalinimonas alkaloidigena TaxID=1075417 RepID=UPI002404F436|nr:sialate O-acetylesterase [Catalinimonas alkaloidigena]
MKNYNNYLLRFIAILFIAMLGFTSCESPDATGVEIHQLFSDHAVLQREIPLKIWGNADPGGTVEVSLGEQSQRAEADADGNWMVELSEMTAGGPYELQITGGDTTIILDDIMIGDVWLASGQSNMQWPLSAQVDNFEEEIANANYPEIRLFTVERNTSYEPLESLAQSSWAQTSPETIGSFSAVAYFFGREIHQELDVPIGLINSSWGGTPAEAWTSEEAVSDMSEFADTLQQIEQQLQTDPSTTDVEKRKERDRIVVRG